MRWFLGIVAAILIGASEPAVAGAPEIVQQATSRAFALVPTGLTRPAPLIVLLHGAGGDARRFLDQFREDAQANGVILLSVQSEGRTWALRKPRRGDADVANINSAMSELRKRVSLDPGRTTVMGFSDGASYALSIGMAYPDLFPTIVAFSPGYAFAPPRIDTRQRIFIAHGRRDRTLPAANVREMIEGLESAGYSPEVHWFNGGHEIDPDLKKLALDFALEPTRTRR